MQLKLLATLADNVTTTYTDAAADGALGADAPIADTSGLTQPDGQVLAGATTALVAGAGAFSPTGGWALAGDQAIRYQGISGNTLTGIPASGPGALQATLSYNTTITAAPALAGVSGLVAPLVKGALINLWVQRDDLVAQAARIAAEGGGDGVYGTG